MLCPHLAQLEQLLLEANIAVTYRGRPWSSNCRQWVYFACYFDRPAVRALLELADCVIDHEHRGTHDGQEAGFVCSECHDAVMGLHPTSQMKAPVFPGGS